MLTMSVMSYMYFRLCSSQCYPSCDFLVIVRPPGTVVPGGLIIVIIFQVFQLQF